MAHSVLQVLAMATAAATGILAGASLDQSIKQLPSRRRIGDVAYAQYVAAADLGNGIAWYAAVGIGSAVLCVGTAVASWASDVRGVAMTAAATSAALAVAHSLVTARAAPTLFKSKAAQGDAVRLRQVFDRFARLQAARATLQLLNFGAALACLMLVARQ